MEDHGGDSELVVSLTDGSRWSPSRVGGKASSLAGLCSVPGVVVPMAFCLTVEFFGPWIDRIEGMIRDEDQDEDNGKDQDQDNQSQNQKKHKHQQETHARLREACRREDLLPLTRAQALAIRELVRAMEGRGETRRGGGAERKGNGNEHENENEHETEKGKRSPLCSVSTGLWAVRSSAPEEDGGTSSFAGVFSTELGVANTERALEEAVRECFSSLWDSRVWDYRQQQQKRQPPPQPQQQQQQQQGPNQQGLPTRRQNFCVVAMEMIDPVVAGVAFSANPLNSDRDEMVVDSSWGLGESVVDGSVVADRYVLDKLAVEEYGCEYKHGYKHEYKHERGPAKRPGHRKRPPKLQPFGRDLVREASIGEKGIEKRLDRTAGRGVATLPIAPCDPRFRSPSLDAVSIAELAETVCRVEAAYGRPMDVEWAFVETDTEKDTEKEPPDHNGQKTHREKRKLSLFLLQARPITTLYTLDAPFMATAPREARRLYFDTNIASEATTTKPFSRLDMDFWNKATTAMMGVSFGDAEKRKVAIFSEARDAEVLLFNGPTRQYLNLGVALNYASKESMAEFFEMMDPYLASIMTSKDCDEKAYRTGKWIPKGVNPWSAYKLLSTFPIWEFYTKGKKYAKDPKGSIEKYRVIVARDLERLDSLAAANSLDLRGNGTANRCETGPPSLKKVSAEIVGAIHPSCMEECGAIQFTVLKIVNELDDQRRNGATDNIREEYGALCGGFEGDELMQMNIALYRLARCLPEATWEEYDGSTNRTLGDLAERIQRNAEGGGDGQKDLPREFLQEWETFLNRFGFDGEDQLFVSCPRYKDRPELLLQKLRLNAIGSVKDPAVIAKEQLEKRRIVQARHEAAAGSEAEKARSVSPWRPVKRWLACRKADRKLAKIRKRNEILDHVFWLRNAPKLHLTKAFGTIRSWILVVEEGLIEDGMLEQKGDIFHLDMNEVDRALAEQYQRRTQKTVPKTSEQREAKSSSTSITTDWIEIIRPRRAAYDRALSSKQCPILVDSRCRILRPDPPLASDDPSILVGSPISPGTATGRVRIVHSVADHSFRPGEVLCAVVTGPAWTPLFASASAVVLQIGGVLQHGALCAREYGKPAVSTIDVNSLLADGMVVEVNGTTGVVKILENESDGSP
ncbi:unnamed protein product [Pseudo-nitzschia multistriata]|uniref:PEP-utilising enzyme mobile domain-containing protein n=1 Tax=Pseudo-nitzschia multistriata TaxID=183589 RepID=A0A448ZDG3_9STRA|nr:unnamed protein product [Pseudo-nitzschia multistriata]